MIPINKWYIIIQFPQWSREIELIQVWEGFVICIWRMNVWMNYKMRVKTHHCINVSEKKLLILFHHWIIYPCPTFFFFFILLVNTKWIFGKFSSTLSSLFFFVLILIDLIFHNFKYWYHCFGQGISTSQFWGLQLTQCFFINITTLSFGKKN